MERRSCFLGLCLSACLALGSGACPWPENSDRGPNPAPKASPARPEAGAFGPWKYEPTLRKHAPDGLYLEAVLELEEPNAGRVDILVAAGRADGPTLELWRFVSSPSDGVLAPQGDPSPLLRTSSTMAPRPDVRTFRSRMAAPHNRVRRPLGLAASDQQLLGRLQELARVVRDQKAPSRDRAAALAQVTRGLDDTLLLDTDRTFEVLDFLVGLPPDATAKLESTARLSSGTLGGREIALMRKSQGWVLSGLSARPAGTN